VTTCLTWTSCDDVQVVTVVAPVSQGLVGQVVMLGFVSMTTDFNRDDYLTVEQVADMWGIRPNSCPQGDPPRQAPRHARTGRAEVLHPQA
jgi:hypothetical protein